MNYLRTVRYPHGAIIFVNDKTHENPAPYLIVSTDDSGYARPILAMAITSKFNPDASQWLIPIDINGTTSFIKPASVKTVDIPEGNVVQINSFVSKEVFDICMNMFKSRLGMFSRSRAMQDADNYRAYYKILDIPLYSKMCRDKNQKKVIINTRNLSKPTAKSDSYDTLPSRIAKWSDTELINWLNDLKTLGVAEMAKKYKFKRETSVYNKKNRVTIEAMARNLTV